MPNEASLGRAALLLSHRMYGRIVHLVFCSYRGLRVRGSAAFRPKASQPDHLGGAKEAHCKAQKKHMTGPRDNKYHKNARGLLVDKENRVWLPPDNELRTRVCIAAHCALAGHRGFHSTYGNMRQVFTFDGMRDYVRAFLSKCLQCTRNESGKVRPLPWGRQMVADRPGQILCADYLYMQAGSKT